MKVEELIVLVHRYNPIWSDEIVKYIKSKKRISRSLIGEHDCIVAELWHMTDRYYNECDICAELAVLLYSYSKDHMPVSFMVALEELYKHAFKKHGKLLS